MTRRLLASLPAHVTEPQRRASDPASSAWVRANAGSGKTYVLTARVLRLLLNGVKPEEILCLTYTKAAAAEMRGRVGDSPIIGAGLYVDGVVAAAVATGDGELMMRACSAFHIVEMIRQGTEPEEACKRAIAQIRRDKHLTEDMQCGLMVIRSDGAWAARALRPGFQLAAASDTVPNKMCDVG